MTTATATRTRAFITPALDTRGIEPVPADERTGGPSPLS